MINTWFLRALSNVISARSEPIFAAKRPVYHDVYILKIVETEAIEANNNAARLKLN